LKNIERRWEESIRKNTTLPLNEFLKAISIVLNSTFFNELIFK